MQELTDNHVHPSEPTQMDTVFDDVFVCGQQYLEVTSAKLALKDLALCRITLVGDGLHAGRPFGKLARPIRHR